MMQSRPPAGGRGRHMVLPAWMTQGQNAGAASTPNGAAAAPTPAAARAPAPSVPPSSSVSSGLTGGRAAAPQPPAGLSSSLSLPSASFSPGFSRANDAPPTALAAAGAALGAPRVNPYAGAASVSSLPGANALSSSLNGDVKTFSGIARWMDEGSRGRSRSRSGSRRSSSRDGFRRGRDDDRRRRSSASSRSSSGGRGKSRRGRSSSAASRRRGRDRRDSSRDRGDGGSPTGGRRSSRKDRRRGRSRSSGSPSDVDGRRNRSTSPGRRGDRYGSRRLAGDSSPRRRNDRSRSRSGRRARGRSQSEDRRRSRDGRTGRSKRSPSPSDHSPGAADASRTSAATLADRLMEVRQMPRSKRASRRSDVLMFLARDDDFYAEDRQGRGFRRDAFLTEMVLDAPETKVRVNKRLLLEESERHSFSVDFEEHTEGRDQVVLYECVNGKVVRVYCFRDSESLVREKLPLEDLKKTRIYAKAWKYCSRKGVPSSAQHHYFDYVHNPEVIG
ncbi:hypothetical protein BESB_073640 [Besnoitia besnoiti]|uniref:Uncharacterized protein n=1 Tax=Besnoitia besnoiti TaxID=94643 RepID=A0A2A9MFQ4_BESBE|nr:uncharacterized protein BESB_073640 [Besnoitia besnoiti]PFH34212.1 hypothetical protein BESB_073640 [Besnoitia besnoiti]